MQWAIKLNRGSNCCCLKTWVCLLLNHKTWQRCWLSLWIKLFYKWQTIPKIERNGWSADKVPYLWVHYMCVEVTLLCSIIISRSCKMCIPVCTIHPFYRSPSFSFSWPQYLEYSMSVCSRRIYTVLFLSDYMCLPHPYCSGIQHGSEYWQALPFLHIPSLVFSHRTHCFCQAGSEVVFSFSARPLERNTEEKLD